MLLLRLKRVTAVITVPLLLSACDTMETNGMLSSLSKSSDSLIRTFSPATQCNAYFRGSSREIAGTFCRELSTLVGAQLKNLLKAGEQVQLAEATNATFATGRKQEVRTEEGNTITTELITPAPKQSLPRSSVPAKSPPLAAKTQPQPQPKPQQRPAQEAQQTQLKETPPPPVLVATAIDQDCGTVKQTVVTKDNQRYEDTVSACKKGTTWVAG